MRLIGSRLPRPTPMRASMARPEWPGGVAGRPQSRLVDQHCAQQQARAGTAEGGVWSGVAAAGRGSRRWAARWGAGRRRSCAPPRRDLRPAEASSAPRGRAAPSSGTSIPTSTVITPRRPVDPGKVIVAVRVASWMGERGACCALLALFAEGARAAAGASARSEAARIRPRRACGHEAPPESWRLRSFLIRPVIGPRSGHWGINHVW